MDQGNSHKVRFRLQVGKIGPSILFQNGNQGYYEISIYRSRSLALLEFNRNITFNFWLFVILAKIESCNLIRTREGLKKTEVNERKNSL